MKKIIFIIAICSASAVARMVATSPETGINTKTPIEKRTTSSFTRPAVQTPCDGRIDRLYLYSPQMKDSVTIDVWMPSAYMERPSEKFPVVYMHDGQNLFDVSTTWNHQSWEMDSVVTDISRKNLIRTPIIVGIHSVAETRVADLMPERPFRNTDILETLDKKQLKVTPLRGDAYAAFVATTLRQYIEDNYRVIANPQNRYVMGSSMGGLMSLYLMCEYPDVFSKAACLSTHWVGSVEKYAEGYEKFPQAMYEYVKEYLPKDGNHAVYFDRGTATIDAYYGKWDDRIIKLVENMGYTRPDRLDSMVAPGAAHEENAWKARVDRPLLFLLKK